MTVVPVKKAKDMTFQDSIVESCIRFMEGDNIPRVDVRFLETFNSVYNSYFQYPIDAQLEAENTEKRRAAFSKVRILIVLTLYNNAELFQAEATEKYKIRSRMKCTTLESVSDEDSDEDEDQDEEEERSGEDIMEVDSDASSADGEDGGLGGDTTWHWPSRYRRLLALLDE